LLGLFCWEDACQSASKSATYCTEYYGFKRMKEEQVLLIQPKNIMDAARIEPMTSWSKTSTPLNHEDSYLLRASFFHLAELATSEF
jgi:hypothetical protein